MASSVQFLLTQPWAAVAVLFDHPLKVALWLLHFVPLLLLPVLSPVTLMAMPILCSRLFNDRLNVWSPVYQYDAILAPILLMAAIEVAARLGLRWPRVAKLPTVVASVLLAAGLVGTAFFPQVFPFHRTVTGELHQRQHGQDLAHAVSLIPDGVCVEAADNAVPHLTTRTYVGLHGDIGDELSTWMIVDTRVEELGGWDPLTPDQALERADRLGFTEVWRERDVVVLEKQGAPVSPVCSDYLRR